MRLAIVLTMLALSVRHALGAELGYVVVDAVRLPYTDKQPTWIALRKGKGQLLHFPADAGLLPLEPGRYAISHVDFQEDKNSGVGTAPIAKRDRGYFEVEAGSILYVGTVQLGPKVRRFKQFDVYEIALATTKNSLANACRTDPEVFSRLLVRLVAKDESVNLVRVRCET